MTVDTEATAKALLEVSRELARDLHPPDMVERAAVMLAMQAVCVHAGISTQHVADAMASHLARLCFTSPRPHEFLNAVGNGAAQRLHKILTVTRKRRLGQR